MPVLEPGVFTAPGHWHTLDFISDLHLAPEEPGTFALWTQYMRQPGADAVIILGDLFEAWVGDDAAAVPGSFEAECAQVLADCPADLAFMRGNRDFLVGRGLLDRLGVHELPDPCRLDWQGESLLLSHGDLLCVDDTAYQQFRRQVRSPAWQQEFLARPLAERQALARHMRAQSQAAQAAVETLADVDDPSARQWLLQAGVRCLIHGHTHRPADHGLGQDPAGRPLTRIVLSDWHVDAHTRRAEILRLRPGESPQRIDPNPCVHRP